MEEFYAGIGSRKVTAATAYQMSYLGSLLAEAGYILRSGGADGSDTMFENGCNSVGGKKLVYLPWSGFNGNSSKLFGIGEQALQIASEIHPYWRILKDSVRKLMARNVYQVLGYNLQKPSKFVVCWTPDGCESHNTYQPEKTGGTGLAIAVASKFGIPVFNLKNEGRYSKVIALAVTRKEALSVE